MSDYKYNIGEKVIFYNNSSEIEGIILNRSTIIDNSTKELDYFYSIQYGDDKFSLEILPEENIILNDFKFQVGEKVVLLDNNGNFLDLNIIFSILDRIKFPDNKYQVMSENSKTVYLMSEKNLEKFSNISLKTNENEPRNEYAIISDLYKMLSSRSSEKDEYNNFYCLECSYLSDNSHDKDCKLLLLLQEVEAYLFHQELINGAEVI